ncbi:MAG: DUF6788 family protein [Acidimicrobiales bacterium]
MEHVVDPARECRGVQLDASTRTDAQRVAEEIARVAGAGSVLLGTLTRRHTRCGRAGCRCMADPRTLHGPYWSWTRKIDRKTVTRYLSDEEARDYEAWFDNAKRLRGLLDQLEALGLRALEGGSFPPSHAETEPASPA